MDQGSLGYTKSLLPSNGWAYFAFWLIVPLSCLTIHHVFPVPPTLLFMVLGFVVLLISLGKVAKSLTPVLPLLIIIYIQISQFALGAPLPGAIGVTASLFYFVIIVAFGFSVTKEQVIQLSKWFVILSTVILVAECVWRLGHPDTGYLTEKSDNPFVWIYAFKFASFMYKDSNATGTHLIVVLFFLYYMEKRFRIKWKAVTIVLWILLFLTFSRSNWIAGVAGLLYLEFFLRLNRRNKIGFLASMAILFVLALWSFSSKLALDKSLLTKVDIASATFHYLGTANYIELLFGVGLSGSTEVLGIYAHSYFLIFLIETGMIGFLLMILLFFHFSFITNRSALIIVIPFFISTLTASITFIPFFYVAIAIIYLIEKSFTSSINHGHHENKDPLLAF